ncbi:MAG: hypothetical protein GX552_10320 [Chloroflexi bacterium]|jgi:hypothetical protein|nr:hypothetical protein [Chloroflexota bacterium]
MIGNQVPVTLVTHEHLLSGTLITHGDRLLDILNSTLTDMLCINDVQISRVGLADRVATSLPSATVRKTSIDLAVLRNTEHEAPEKRWYSYVEKQPRRIFLTLPGCHVDGTVRLTHTPQPAMAVLQQRDDFVPITGATVTMADGEVVAAQVVMVRRDSIGLLYVGEPTVGGWEQ